MHIPKWLIATAALLFVVLIAAVAFFLGRQTSSTTIAVAAPQPSSVTEPAPAPESKPPVADAGGSATSSPITSSPSGTAPAYAPPPAASASPTTSSTPAAAADTTQATNEVRVRVSTYFRQMEALQTAGPGADPDSFANTIIQGATSGDFSGLDELVRSAGDAERRASALQPPPECAEYHRMALTLLQDSRTMLTSLRDGLKRNDADALSAMAASAQSMKSRADNLAAAEKSLRARYGG